MIDTFINGKSEVVVIKQMDNLYLVNAYNAFKKQNKPEQEELVGALLSEIHTRGIQLSQEK